MSVTITFTNGMFKFDDTAHGVKYYNPDDFDLSVEDVDVAMRSTAEGRDKLRPNMVVGDITAPAGADAEAKIEAILALNATGAGDASAANQVLLIDILETPTTISDGSKDIAVTGTAIALGTTKTIKYVVITAKPGNAGIISTGGSGVGNGTSGVLLAASEAYTMYIDDLSKAFINGADTDGVTFSDYV